MYFAHFGLAIFILGASISENNKIEKELVLNVGESKTIGIFEYKLEKLK
jgi:cytochrome c biogenesis factor